MKCGRISGIRCTSPIERTIIEAVGAPLQFPRLHGATTDAPHRCSCADAKPSGN